MLVEVGFARSLGTLLNYQICGCQAVIVEALQSLMAIATWCRLMSYVLTSKCPIDLALSVPVKQEGA